MARSFVLTNRRKLDEFLRRGNSLDDIGMLIGQTTGKPKYPPGHVGSKSRQKDRVPSRKIKRQELERRMFVRMASKQLEGLSKDAKKQARKRWKDWFEAEEKRRGRGRGSFRFRGVGRKKRQAVAVARVAGVIASDRSTGQYHERVLGGKKAVINPAEIYNAMFTQNITIGKAITNWAKQKKAELRKSFLATGHSDTGRLLRNINYIIWTVGGKKKALQRDKELRDLAKAQRAARKTAKGK